MKKISALIAAAVCAAAMLTSCAKEAPVEPAVIPSRPTEAIVPEETIPASLPQLEEIDHEDIAYIEFWNESMSPDEPVARYTSDTDISSLFTQLKSIRRTSSEPLSEEEFAPGAGGQYVLYLFSGEKPTVSFHLDCVLIEGEFYPCDSRPEQPEQKILLRTELPSYPAADTENIEYSAYNGTEEDYAIQLIPRLERMTEEGWEQAEYKEIGFCGTPAPFPPSGGRGIVDYFSLSWFEGISAGTYRLSLYYFDEGEEHLVSTVFTLC